MIQKIDVKGKDETADLAKGVNIFIEGLQNLMRDIIRESSEINKIVLFTVMLYVETIFLSAQGLYIILTLFIR